MKKLLAALALVFLLPVAPVPAQEPPAPPASAAATEAEGGIAAKAAEISAEVEDDQGGGRVGDGQEGEHC